MSTDAAAPLEIGGHTFRREDFEVILRLGPGGSVLHETNAAEDLPDVVAYTARLAELIGGALGLERFVAMECVFKTARYFVVAEGAGRACALRPRPSADLTVARVLFGL